MEPDLAANTSLDLGEKDPLVRDRRNKRRALSCPLAREDGEEAIAAAGWQRSGRPTALGSATARVERKAAAAGRASEGGTESTDITAANVQRGESSYLELHARRLSSEPLPSSSSPPLPTQSLAQSERNEVGEGRGSDISRESRVTSTPPSFLQRIGGGVGEVSGARVTPSLSSVVFLLLAE